MRVGETVSLYLRSKERWVDCIIEVKGEKQSSVFIKCMNCSRFVRNGLLRGK